MIFYLICGMAGAFSYLVLWGFNLLGGGPWVPLVGASAGIFGVLIASALVAPDVTVLLWGIVPLKMRTLAWGLLAFAVYSVFFRAATNAGGEAAHLGGALVGFLLIRYPRPLNVLTRLTALAGPGRPAMRYRG